MWSQLLSARLSFPERAGLRAPAGRKVLNFPGRGETSRRRTGLGAAIWGCQERGEVPMPEPAFAAPLLREPGCVRRVRVR